MSCMATMRQSTASRREALPWAPRLTGSGICSPAIWKSRYRATNLSRRATLPHCVRGCARATFCWSKTTTVSGVINISPNRPGRMPRSCRPYRRPRNSRWRTPDGWKPILAKASSRLLCQSISITTPAFAGRPACQRTIAPAFVHLPASSALTTTRKTSLT